MNKLALSLALVAVVFVALAAANKLPHRKHHHHDDFEEELEEHRPVHHHGHKHGHHQHGHKHGLQHGHEHGHQHGHKHGLQHAHHGNKHAGHHGHRHGKGFKAGVGAGVRSEHEFDAGVHQGTRLGSHKSIEGEKAFVAGHKKQFGAGVQHHDSHDNEGHHKTRVHNKNKLIVAEKDQGFEDDKGFRHHDEHDDQAQIGASDSKFVGGKAGGKIVSDHGLEHESDAGIHGESEHEAGIGAGIEGHSGARALAAGAGIGAGLRHSKEFDAGVHHGTRIGSHKSIEGEKAFGVGHKKQFGAGVQHHDSHDIEGHHKTRVHNKNKLIVAEKDQGFEDDKGFRHRHDHSDQAQIGASDSKFVGGKAGGKIVSDHGLEHESDAGIHGESEHEAGIGAGIGAHH